MVQAENWSNTPPDERAGLKPMSDASWDNWCAKAQASTEKEPLI